MTGGKAMAYTLNLLKQIADGLAKQFGPDCEIVIHDLKRHDLEHSVVHINNGHVTNRRRRPFKDRPGDAPQGPCFVKGSCRLSDAHIKWKDFKIQHILHKK